MVEDRLIAAESTLRRLPEETLRGSASSWPDVVHEQIEAYGWNAPTKIKTRPSPRDIDQMQITLQWLLLLDETDRRIVWGRAEMKPWPRLAGENGIAVRDAKLAWVAGLISIAHRLNSPNRPNVRKQLMAMPVSPVYAVAD